MPSQISGSSAVAIQVYQALYGRAPSNALLNAYTAQASANPQSTAAASASAFANDLASGFQSTSDAALALQVLNNINITAATVTAAGQYSTLLSALTQAFTGFGPAARGQIILNVTNLLAKLEGDATYGVAATGFNNQAYGDFVYASVATNTSPFVVTPTLTTFALTTGADNVQGTAGDDLIIAAIFDNQNSLQSGDKIAGGAGLDRLAADMGSSQNFAVTPETTGVEQVAIRAQSNSFDSGQNNVAGLGKVDIDAQRMVGVNQWESNNSRADLIVEDVRILPNQITKDITIAFIESDPGHVDFGLYFDQLSLRSQSNTTSVLSIEILDTRSAAAGTGPLKDNPYDSFAFLINGTPIIVKSPAIDAALTYADLRTAVSDQIALLKATTPLLANFTVTLGAEFTRFDTQTGAAVKGTAIVLTDTGGGVLTVNPNAGFATPSGVVPPSSGLHTNISTVATSSTDKVTSKIILDDVGRGSTSGDLVIGGLSTGASSTSRGVERFEIRVDDNSKLETINSTNNTLQEVTIVNGLTSSNSFAYQATVKDKGNLTVNGVSGLNGGNVTVPGMSAVVDGSGAVTANVPFPVTSGAGQSQGIDAQVGNNAPLPGSAAQTARGYGFSDVRLLDGSAMTGQLAFSAEVTGASIAKYMNLKDTGALPAADNIAFVYSGGSNNDAMFMTLDAGVASSRSTYVSGREDFTFTANGGAGNDTITLNVAPGLRGGAQAWYTNQKLNANIFVNGGDGNDTIKTPGAGDKIIDAGTGDDTVYADNSGSLGATAVATGSAGTGAIAYTNAAAAELAAGLVAAAAANATDATATPAAAAGFGAGAAAVVAALNALDQITANASSADLTAAAVVPAPPTAGGVTTATQNAYAAGAITAAQKVAIDIAYNAVSAEVVVAPVTLGALATFTTTAPVGVVTVAAGDAAVAPILVAANTALAAALGADAKLVTQNALLDGTQLAVEAATQAMVAVDDRSTGGNEAGTTTILNGLIAIQSALVLGATDVTVVAALNAATASGAILAATATNLFGAAVASAGTMDATEVTAVGLLLSPLINNATNANTGAQVALTAAIKADTAVQVANAALAAGNNNGLAPDSVSSAQTTAAAAAAAAAATTAATNLATATAKEAGLISLRGSITTATTEVTALNLLNNAQFANFISGPENTALAGFVGAAATSTLVTPAQKLAFDTGATGFTAAGSVDALITTAHAAVEALTVLSTTAAANAAATATANTIMLAAVASGGTSLTIAAPRAVFVFDTSNQTSTYNPLTQDDRNLADLKSDVNNTNNFFNSTVKVVYKGLVATSIPVPGTGYKTTDLELNQAIKAVINGDPVLSKLLVANDGPANTLIVSSLIDGTHTTSNLAISVTMPTSVTSADVAGAIAAGLVPAASTDAALITALGVAKAAFDTKGDYVTQFAESGANGGNTVLTGANSVTSSDNTITPGLGNDVIVLGTTVGTDLLTSSNEIVVYAGLFGNDTIVNFAVAGLGIDQLNFGALNGSAANFGSLSADKSIVVGAATAAGATVLTAAQIAALFTDSATAINHVYVAVDSNNVGSIWQVADAAGTAAGNVTATLVGSINLADTSWAGMTAANFV